MSDVITNNLDLWTSAILTKSTAGRGNNGKQQAYGIKKLRELILELAVRGKFVPQDPNDEPASVLLEETMAVKKRLIKEGAIRNTKSPALSPNPPAYELPNTWVWTNLYEIGEIGPRYDAEDDLEASFIPMPLISEYYGVPVGHEVKQWVEIKNGFTHFKEEDVVLAKITPCFQNGKSAVMRGLTNGFGAGTTELHVYRSINSCTVPEYVLIYLKSPGFILEGVPKMTGTAGQKRITRDYFAGNHFPLPPLTEQHRIVAKVDELMALCDQLEQQQTHSLEAHQTLVASLLGTLTNVDSAEELAEAWTRIANHFDTLFTTEHSIDQLKQTILQLAVMGKLAPQDPNDEPAIELLAKAFSAKEEIAQSRGIRNDKEEYKPSSVFSAPQSWHWACVGEFAHVLGGKRVPRGYALLETPTDHVYIRVTDMKEQTVSQNELRYIDEEIYNQISKYIINSNDIYVTIAGTIGAVGTVPQALDGMNLTENASKLVFKNLDQKYLVIALSSSYIQNQFYEAVNQMAQPKLSLTSIKHTNIAIPPIAEQHRIVAKVDELMTLCDALKTRLADAQTIQIHLADAIVEQAVA